MYFQLFCTKKRAAAAPAIVAIPREQAFVQENSSVWETPVFSGLS